jgi:hypothetical protein
MLVLVVLVVLLLLSMLHRLLLDSWAAQPLLMSAAVAQRRR